MCLFHSEILIFSQSTEHRDALGRVTSVSHWTQMVHFPPHILHWARGRTSPGHIPCVSLVVFLKNILISYRGLDLWPLLPTIFASINSELYSKKAPREEQLPATIRQ